MNVMRNLRALVGLLILIAVAGLFLLTCEKPVTNGGSSDNTDTTANVDVEGVYYGYLTTDYYTLGQRTLSRIHITVTHSADERNGCTCVYDILVADSITTIANVCARGRSSRLTSDCADSLYHDIFLGTGDGSNVSGIIERYKLQPTGREVHYSTMSFDASLR
ncbi:hypothetical protein C3F09_04890 [candidate division GN15 bacterium]|uniref:Uncharacterized protein n=1 Tax=candidate division GN15 bacterium TaxID=2072418 RepID=A0A855X258_9BACT|nr:MAG: hypothetical protein C3F09_04890 [candidate division GN15 bacterium]